MITSVYITNEAVQVVQGHTSGKKIVVDGYVSEPFSEEGCIINGVVTNEAVLVKQISELWKKAGFPKKGVRLIVDNGSVPTKMLKLPNVPEAQLLNVIANNFSDLGGSDDRVFDYTIINSKNDEGGITALACTAEEEFITGYIELFKKCDIDIGAMSLSLGCEIGFVNHIKQLLGRTFIIALLDKNTISCSLFVDGKYSFSNRTRIVAERDSEDITEEIARRISSMVQFNKSEKNSSDITNVYFAGLHSQEHQICAAITQAVGISAELLPNFPEVDVTLSKMKKPDGFKLNAADCLYALGNIAAK